MFRFPQYTPELFLLPCTSNFLLPFPNTLESLFDDLNGSWPSAGVVFHHLDDERLQVCGNKAICRETLRLDLLGLFACQQRLQGRSQTIDVGLRCGLGFSILFWRCITGRAKRHGVFALSKSIAASNTEVNQIDLSSAGPHDIGWLDIAKYNGLFKGMQILERLAQGDPNAQHLISGQTTTTSFCEALFEGLSLDILEDDIPVIRIGEMVIQAGYVFMIQITKERNFAIIGIGCIDDLLRAQRGERNLLENNQSVGLLDILGFVNGAEASLANLLKNTIAPHHQRTKL